MKIVNIPLARIRVPEVRITARYDDELAANLHGSLTELGQVEPILVLRDGEDYILVDGLHRTQEARERGGQTIPAVVRDGDARQAVLLNLATSHNKGKTHPGDTLAIIRYLLESEGMSSDDIAAATGMSRDQIERFWRIAEASPVVQMAIQEGTVALGAAYHIARLPHHAQQEELLSTQLVYRRPVPEIKALVDETLQIMSTPRVEEPAPVLSPPPPPTCGGCHQAVTPRQLVPVPLCPSCYGQVYRLARAAVPASGDAVPAPPAP